MKILVTGGAGFIGSHTADKLLSEGHDVRIVDNLQKPVHLKGKPAWLPGDAEFIEADVRDKRMWEKALEGVDAVYHFAAYQDYFPDFSTFFHVNAVSTAMLYEVAVEKRLDLAKVVVSSSQFVQGEGLYECVGCGMSVGPNLRAEEQMKKGQWEHVCPSCNHDLQWTWTNEKYAAPPNAYSMSKQSQETQVLAFGKRYQIPSVALRYSIVQGPRQSFYNAYSGTCRIFSLYYYFDRPPVLYEDGMQCRDFVNIHDVVRANVQALNDQRMDYNTFNIGGGHAYTVKEFAEIVRGEVKKYKNNQLPDPEIPNLYRFGDTRNACSDISKMKALGWEPTLTCADSVKEYVAWLYEQKQVDDILEYSMKTMKDFDVVRKADGELKITN